VIGDPARVRQPRRPCGDELDGRIAYDELPDGLVVADDTGQVTLVNRRAQQLLGLPADELIGKDLPHVLPLTDTEGRDWWAVADPYGGPATRIGHPERSLLLAGRELLVCAAYIREHPLDRVHRVVVTLRSGAARERAERGRADLVATVLHELRNPLAAIRGYTAILIDSRGQLDEVRRRRALDRVRAETIRLTRLIDDLSAVARIESGRLELRRRPIDVVELIRRQVDWRVAAGGDPGRYRIDVVGPAGKCCVDADRVAQVLENLLDNAEVHGAGLVTIRVETSREGTAITVSDRGLGVPAEQAVAVFDRFWRGRRTGGTGLGLHIAKGIVEAHGGTIGVGRSPGGGAAFRFTLPA